MSCTSEHAHWCSLLSLLLYPHHSPQPNICLLLGRHSPIVVASFAYNLCIIMTLHARHFRVMKTSHRFHVIMTSLAHHLHATKAFIAHQSHLLHYLSVAIEENNISRNSSSIIVHSKVPWKEGMMQIITANSSPAHREVFFYIAAEVVIEHMLIVTFIAHFHSILFFSLL